MHPLIEKIVARFQANDKNETCSIEELIQIEEGKLYAPLGHASLFVFCVKALGRSNAQAREMTGVANKARVFSSLRLALRENRITVSKAARIVSSLTVQNQIELVEFACAHALSEIEDKISADNPERKISKKISLKNRELMKRAREVSGLSEDEMITVVFEFYLDKHDKLRKAKRAKPRKVEAPKILESRKRVALPAATKHALELKYKGQCAILDHKDERCPNRTFVENHHIIEVQHGGGDEIGNLIVVCSEHHELIHQTQFPIAGAVNWREVISRSCLP